MKFQVVFSLKGNGKCSRLSSAAVLIGAVRVEGKATFSMCLQHLTIQDYYYMPAQACSGIT